MWVDQIPEDFPSSFGTTTLNAWRHMEAAMAQEVASTGVRQW
jgi:hypothetical protein